MGIHPGRWMRLFLLTASIASTATAGPKSSVQPAWVKAAKARIEVQLVDPGSVQYRRLWVAEHTTDSGRELVLCGELNAKNSFGGYAGFRPFISTLGSMVYMGDQIDALLPEYCGAKLLDVK
jgi:hypothetical protein